MAGFDFAEWQQQQDAKRAARRAELLQAFRNGLAVTQAGTVWTTAGVIYRDGRADAVFIDSAQSDPAYLAEHIENREYGFGFHTSILRSTLHSERIG